MDSFDQSSDFSLMLSFITTFYLLELYIVRGVNSRIKTFVLIFMQILAAYCTYRKETKKNIYVDPHPYIAWGITGVLLESAF